MTARQGDFRGLLRVFFLTLLVALGASAPFSDSIAATAVPKGNAAWLYPETQQQVDDWKAQLTTFNLAAGAERAIRVLYVYSTDLETTYTKPVIGTLAKTAVTTLRGIPNVTHVAAIIDADLTASYANLNKLTTAKINALADAHARLYCESSFDGIQLDLEPYNPTYKNSVLTFVRRLSLDLRDPSYCTRPKFIAFFVGPRQADATLYGALGPNGYAVISGYDLDSPGPGLPETPEQYRINLKSNVNFVINNANSTYGKFSIGLPFAASACEFESGVSLTDPSNIIQGYPMYDPVRPSYIPSAFDVLNQTIGSSGPSLTSRFLGVSVWGFLSRDVRVLGYRHTPKNVFDTPGMMSYMAANMPRKAVMPLSPAQAVCTICSGSRLQRRRQRPYYLYFPIQQTKAREYQTPNASVPPIRGDGDGGDDGSCCCCCGGGPPAHLARTKSTHSLRVTRPRPRANTSPSQPFRVSQSLSSSTCLGFTGVTFTGVIFGDFLAGLLRIRKGREKL
ncbi:hypothetical protein VOLCADRAFT_95239 [Volvox carteri f. nagariensis]|uniref:GH18 domain-containing protein n=1 Tax=Volvox carteri f. nagariensis TaxID=3068 RepID=D8U6Z3_VOLCA|nr:uncharacterized protein VOLCADRAFT_95239 [Volvox carteri f. nagariensis]EFJ44597.1 hypothetical protein VOLCADRAFT_95239 [Volvox carteri f. nagariensis]|eukprot:XP_002954447.1 hypothetical protein VOLCADRAFT_95239 [Volvox carteri f. nagariensis]